MTYGRRLLGLVARIFWVKKVEVAHGQSGSGSTTARHRARSIVLTWLLAFASVQILLAAALEGPLTDVRNPIQAPRERYLLAQLREEPTRPWVLALGSSQTQAGLRPGILEERRSDDDPLVFNFGLPGYGPSYQYAALRGLLARGLKPNGLIIEIMPGLLALDPAYGDFGRLGKLGWDWTEARALADAAQSWRAYFDWIELRIVPAWSYRRHLRDRLPPQIFGAPVDHWGQSTDRFGWFRISCSSDPQFIETNRQLYQPLLRKLQVPAVHTRAMNQMLNLCRSLQIPVLLVIPPEGPAYLSWYGPSFEPVFQAYLAGIRADFGVPIVDARKWLADEGKFADSVHLLPDGAAEFTERLAQEARPFLELVKSQGHR
jgi:hypothetical protein